MPVSRVVPLSVITPDVVSIDIPLMIGVNPKLLEPVPFEAVNPEEVAVNPFVVPNVNPPVSVTAPLT